MPEMYYSTIASGIKQNLRKVNHHGKLDDSIEKGLLRHICISCPLIEPTNINTLVVEIAMICQSPAKTKISIIAIASGN